MKARHLACTAAVLLVAGCGPKAAAPGQDIALEGLALTSVAPDLLVPGTTVVVEGRSFVEEPWGTTYLQLEGEYAGAPVSEVLLPAKFIDFDHLEIDVDGTTFALLGADEGVFAGRVTVVVDSGVDGQRYRSNAVDATLDFRAALTPNLDNAELPGIVFVNSDIAVTGANLLLGGNEGDSTAVLEGLFEDSDGNLSEVGPVDARVIPSDDLSRTRGYFALPPELTGIHRGQFVGTLTLRNDHVAGAVESSTTTLDMDFDLEETTVIDVSPSAVSLGQYMDINGGGFLGDGATTVRLSGTYTRDQDGAVVPLETLIEIVPKFVSGSKLRYVVNEDDLPLDLRKDSGRFDGELIPIVSYAGEELEGSSVQFQLQLAPVKQVVYLKFTSNFVEALRDFGLRAVEQPIRDRVMNVVSRDYATVNLEVRMSEPTDFALYAEVEIGGSDPQGLGLLGYDNTPGKDVGNQRLYDRLGGVNAETQHDGYPGYGGVFVESLFAFSKHPKSGVTSASAADSLFDDIFDPFRPDRGGHPVRAEDLQGGIDLDIDPSECPAKTRDKQIACAVFVMGNLVGTTLSHEIGHSLGLANPYGASFHNPFDEPNRLMDGGGDRPFTERAQLQGDGPGVFCDEEYLYLREILPSGTAPDSQKRPTCF